MCVIVHVYSYIVLILDEVDDVGGIVAEYSGAGALDVFAELLVHADLFRDHREDHVDRVLLHLDDTKHLSYAYSTKKLTNTFIYF